MRKKCISSSYSSDLQCSDEVVVVVSIGLYAKESVIKLVKPNFFLQDGTALKIEKFVAMTKMYQNVLQPFSYLVLCYLTEAQLTKPLMNLHLTPQNMHMH